MNEPQNFRMMGDHAEFRPSGEVSQNQMVQLVKSGIAFANEQKVKKLLVVTSELTGFRSPSVVDRYYFISDWAIASGHIMRIALVARPEMIDPYRFGVTVAANNGLIANIFPSEDEALAWLRGTNS